MEDKSFQGKLQGKSNVRGMESVVATVSGYSGLERFRLIKLITQAGANYVGAMTKSTTHLVCWKFEGKKYDLAKKFSTEVVNHRWFEDCMKKGKCLPEDSYTTQSGQQVGPLLLELPVVADAHGKKEHLFTIKKGKVLCDRTNTFDAKVLENDTRCMDVGCSTWSDSRLLREHEEPVCIARNKRNACAGVESTASTNHVRKGRRLVKSNESGQKCYSTGIGIQLNNMDDISNDSNNLRNGNDSPYQRMTSENEFCNYRGNRNVGLVEDIEELNDFPASNDSNKLANEIPSPSQETTSQNCDSRKNRIEEVNEIDDIGDQVGLPTSTELSCVICWTDFSSMRGILPCGHRFCYLCIQSWADHMVSNGKASTCPLCKSSFVSIKKVDGAASSDQKIYSQTLPSMPSEDIIMLFNGELHDYEGQRSSPPETCCECRNREPEDLLVSCRICRSQWVHSYCLDPPLIPWTCIHCRDLRMLYRRFR
ncbi:uncharacterized protein LOC143856552 [Tasmannia lanceolata]|uniref:uncharacterized protein LOC143856552 n=1 Tax=Tasmannia lanceolata TaxID=3420 RepID=UPI0040633E49